MRALKSGFDYYAPNLWRLTNHFATGIITRRKRGIYRVTLWTKTGHWECGIEGVKGRNTTRATLAGAKETLRAHFKATNP